MRETIFENEAMSRYHVLVALVLIRQAICELAFAIGFLVLAFTLANRFPDLPLYAAAGITVGALIAYFRASKALKWVEGQPIETD